MAITLRLHPDATLAELHRVADGEIWHVWFIDSDDRDCEVITKNDLIEEIGDNLSEENVVTYIERRLRDLGYEVSRRTNVPNMVATWDVTYA